MRAASCVTRSTRVQVLQLFHEGFDARQQTAKRRERTGKSVNTKGCVVAHRNGGWGPYGVDILLKGCDFFLELVVFTLFREDHVSQFVCFSYKIRVRTERRYRVAHRSSF